MKRYVTIFLIFGFGAWTGGMATFYYQARSHLMSIYLEESKNSILYISLLRKLHEGDIDDTIKSLEGNLSISEAIIKQCLQGICKEESHELIIKALDRIEEYKKNYANNSKYYTNSPNT